MLTEKEISLDNVLSELKTQKKPDGKEENRCGVARELLLLLVLFRSSVKAAGDFLKEKVVDYTLIIATLQASFVAGFAIDATWRRDYWVIH